MEELKTAAGTCTGASTEKDITAFYEQTFPLVARFVSKMGGSFADARDIFHDALVIFFEKQVNGTLARTLSAEAYVLGIAKHLWLRKFRQDKSRVAFGPGEAAIAIPPEDFGEADNRLLALLERAGRKCLELLQAFYYQKQGLADIAQAFGYQTVRSATVQKYKCLEKVRTQVKQKAISYEDLAD
jgi:DNA-directed RNA polymerase specialized sigma24 family protein